MRADEIVLARPCPIDLERRVAGADQRFHCDHCDRGVLVLSHMTPSEAARALAWAQRESLCVAYQRKPDGDINFVPETALRTARRVLHASALVVSVAACTPHGSDRVPAVDLTAYAATTVRLPTLPTRWFGGAALSAPEDPIVPPFVPVDALEPVSRPLPESDAFPKSELGRPGSSHNVTLGFCVDIHGQVVRPVRLRGAPEFATILTSELSTWRYVPHRIDGVVVEVCTRQRFVIMFGPTRAKPRDRSRSSAR